MTTEYPVKGRKWQAKGYRGWGYSRRRVHLAMCETREEAERVEREWKERRDASRPQRAS